jgi:hypothetical protein
MLESSALRAQITDGGLGKEAEVSLANYKMGGKTLVQRLYGPAPTVSGDSGTQLKRKCCNF